jgi:ABC-type proline/glycine betaine transport system permease subunit
MRVFKNVVTTILICVVFIFILGIISSFAGSIVMPRLWRIDSDFQLGYLAGLVWLFGIGGLVGLIIGILVSAKIWRRIK